MNISSNGFLLFQNDDRIDMEVSHEKKSRKELEKEDLLRRKVWVCSYIV